MKTNFFNFKTYLLQLLSVCLVVFCANSCTELEKPRVTEYYTRSRSFVPGEFRWSVGNLPGTLDPVLIQTPAELQVVRAISAGLTEWNPQTLEAQPAVAEKWEASQDFRTYTFFLRSNTKWTNDENVTAHDFVRSWRRFAERFDDSPHRDLLANFVGIEIV